MTPTSPPVTSLRLTSPPDLLAGVPSLLGFPPVDSLVLITLTATPVLTVAATARANLPSPWEESDLVEQLACAVANHDPTAVVAVVVGGDRDEDDLPCRRLVETLADVMRDEGRPMLHALWAPAIERGAPWLCYLHDACRGEVPDPQCSPVAAMTVAMGRRTFADRADLVTHLAQDPAEVMARRAPLRALHPPPDDEETVDRELAFVYDAIARADANAPNPAVLDDGDVARLGAALTVGRIRDECLSLALTDQAAAAESLWLALTRSLPPPERAEAACLLGVAAYLRGEGALAGVALDVAMEANPTHMLSTILKGAVGMGTTPTTLHRLLNDSITFGRTATHPTPQTPPTSEEHHPDDPQ